MFTELDGFGTTAADYDIRVENRKTRAGVRITADRPIAKFVFWSAPITVCPEPYIDASVAPGQRVVVAHHLSVLRTSVMART